nr:hypothetical protein [uncultured Methanoregula sp.]
MPKIYGIEPKPATKQLIEKFEDEVVIRHNNQQLVGNVYVDMQPDRWAVAFAYNYTRRPGIHGHENPLEVRYSCPAQENTSVTMFRSDTADERSLVTAPLRDGDEFIRYVLSEERSQVGRAA